MNQALADLKLIKIEEAEVSCSTHGSSMGKRITRGKLVTGPSCSKCQAQIEMQEQIREAEKKAAMEAASQKKLIESRLQAAMIPLRFQQHSFATFIEKTDAHKKRKQRCQDYAENFESYAQRGTSMIFCGTTGTGKTHLACSIANHIIQHQDKTAVFLSVINAVRKVKETYRKTSDETEREAIRWFLRPDLLILDEVGVQFGSETEKMILFEIINTRYENMKPTILLSNLSPENLQGFVGERIMDRMKENGGKILTFSWASHRESSTKE